jgi:hypothetical protein
MAPSSASNVLKPGMELVSCDLCRSDQSELVTRQRDLLLEVTQDEFTIVRCRQCGLIYLNPRPSKDLLSSYYPPVYYPPVRAKVRPQLQQQAKKFSAKMKRGAGRLLRVPCGWSGRMVSDRAANSLVAQ